MRPRLFICLIVVAFLSACGSDRSLPKTPAGTFPPPDPTADAALAQKITLTKKDLTTPIDAVQPPDSVKFNSGGTGGVAAACGLLNDEDPTSFTITAQASGPVLGENPNTSFAKYVIGGVRFFDAASVAARDVAVHQSPNSELCLRRLYEPLFAQILGAQWAPEKTTTKLEIVSEKGLSSIRITGTGSANRQATSPTLLISFATVDRAEIVVVQAAVDSVPSTDTARQLSDVLNKKATSVIPQATPKP